MELEQFLSETLKQILAGIKSAQIAAKESGGYINPAILPIHPGPIDGFIRDGSGNFAQIVSFDIALTASEGSSTKGGVGVVAGVFNLGTSGSSQDTNTTVSRVKFSVPIILPTQA